MEEYTLLFNFRLLPVAYSSAKTIQITSSMTFIKSNGCIQVHLILNIMATGFITIRPFCLASVCVGFEPMYMKKKHCSPKFGLGSCPLRGGFLQIISTLFISRVAAKRPTNSKTED